MAGPWDTPPTADEIAAARGGGVWDAPPTPEETAAATPQPEPPGVGESLVTGVGRGAWAIPGLLGLDRAKATAIGRWLDGKMGFTPETTVADAERYERGREAAAEKAHPLATGIGVGVGAAPSMLLAPQAAAPVGASLAARSGAGALTAGAQSAAVEAGVTAGLPLGDRLKRIGAAGVMGAGIGALAPGAPAGAIVQRQAGAAAREAESGAAANARAAAGASADAGASGGSAGAQNVTEIVVRPPKRGMVSRILREPEPVPEAQYLLDRGVPLTKGLNDARSGFAQTEIASQSLEGVGARIRAQRQKALTEAMDLAFQESRPPVPAKARPVNLPPEEYLYHVTPAENADSIARQGLRADAPKIAEGGPHGDTKAVFLSDADTVATYRDLYGADGSPLAVFRVPRSALTSLEEDTASEGVAYLSREHIPARLLEKETEGGWESVAASSPGRREIPRDGDINAKYAALKSMWDDAYGAIRAKDELIQPGIVEAEFARPLKGTPEAPGLLDEIIDDVTDPLAAVWDDASRTQARRFLDNQVTRLKAGAKDEAGRVPLGDMLRTLSDIRKASRAALQSEKYDLHQILARAEDAFEQSIESQATPQTRAELRALNAKYRDFKTVEDAVIRAKDAPGGISPAQLSMSVKATEPQRSRYAAGGGGELRDLSKAVRTVFDESISPPTGARLLSVAPKWAREGFIGPTIFLRNSSQAGAQGGAAGAAAGARAGARSGSSASARLSEALKADPAAFGPYAPRLLSAEAQRGPEGLAAAHYVLSVQDPAYAALMRRVTLSPSQAAAEGEE
jgi:hypothetical protein